MLLYWFYLLVVGSFLGGTNEKRPCCCEVLTLRTAKRTQEFGSVSPLHPPRSLLAQFLDGDKAGGVGGTNTRLAMLSGLLCDEELPQAVASHLWFDLHLVEGLVVVHAHPPCFCHFIILFLRCVFNTMGFSTGGTSFLVFLRHLSSECCVCCRLWFRCQVLPLPGTVQCIICS